MKLFIVIYLMLGAYTAQFVRDLPQPSTKVRMILLGIHLLCFGFVAFAMFMSKKQGGKFLQFSTKGWPIATAIFYLIGFGTMWYYTR